MQKTTKGLFSYLFILSILIPSCFIENKAADAAVYTVSNALYNEQANAKANPGAPTDKNSVSNIINNTENNTDENNADNEAGQLNNQDPYETYNRHTFKMNRTLDKVIFKPVATVYQTVLPAPIPKGISNFFSNLNSGPTVLNDVLQLKFHQGIIDTLRFITNSTAGIGGLMDVASDIGLPKHSEDFGLTLARWGYKNSNYIVLPILGPSTVRDTIGLPVDYETAVTAYVHPVALRNSLWGVNFTSHRANLLKVDKVINQAFDPYVSVRDAYMQFRNNQIKNNGLVESNDSDENTSNVSSH